MPSVNDLKSSKFLTKNDVMPDKLVTIKSYEKLNVAMQSQKADAKWTLQFRELEKPLVLNPTNGQLIAQIMHKQYGISRDLSIDEDGVECPTNEQFQHWVGKKVVLYNDPTISYGTEITGGIRVRAVRQQTEPDAPEPDDIPEPDPSIVENPDHVGEDPDPPPDDGVPF